MNATSDDVLNVPEITQEVQSKAKQNLQVPQVCLRDYVLYWHKNAMLTREIWVISHTLGVDSNLVNPLWLQIAALPRVLALPQPRSLFPWSTLPCFGPVLAKIGQ